MKKVNGRIFRTAAFFIVVLFSSAFLYAASLKDSINQKLDKANKKATEVSEKINDKAKVVTDKIDETLGSPESKENVNSSIESTSQKVSKAAEDITPEQEYYIGRAVAANILSQTPLSQNNSSMELYLNKICQALVINSENPELYNGYHVALLEDNSLNAVSTPGGHILITKGLVKASESEDELAAVLAHEISHIQLKHATKSIKSARTADALVSIVGTTGTIATTGKKDVSSSFSNVADSITETIVESGYSKKSEYDADSNAVELLVAAGYNPEAMTQMLDMLDKKLGSANTGIGKTHPSPKLRKTAVKPAVKLNKNKVDASKASVREERYKKAMATLR